MGSEVSKAQARPSIFLFCLMYVDQNARSQLHRQHHACLHATMLPTTVTMD